MPLGLFLFSVFWWSLAPDLRPPTSGFRLAKQILVASFGTQVRARILGGRNIFCTLGLGQQQRGLMPLGLFLFFFRGHLPQTAARSKQYLPVIFVRLAFIRPNSHENCCRINGDLMALKPLR